MADSLTLAAPKMVPFARPVSALELIGPSAAITRVLELIRRAASLDVGVLFTAEAGVDVLSVARELHGRSRRSAAPFTALEMAGSDASHVAHILFGTSSSTGASHLESVSRDSRIAATRGGTLFLQDVSEMPAAVQARLAHVVRDGEVLIDGVPTPTELRIIASASPAVDADVHAHRLRSDLFRRLAAVRIDLPALRQRLEDVPAIAARALEEIAAAQGRAPRSFTHAALALIAAVTWPGNLAELQAAIARVASEPGDHDIQVEHLLPVLNLQRAPARFVPTGSLREARLKFERDYISAVLQHHGWRMADAALTLGIQRPNLYRKARQLGIPVTRIAE